MSKRDSHLSQDSEALLPGKGHSPSYGINDSADISSSFNNSAKTAPGSVIQGIVSASHKERIWAVAICSLIACLGSLINGIVIGYSSPTLAQLGDFSPKYFGPKSSMSSLFGAFSAIGAMFGGPIAWPLSEKLGRQATLMLSGIPSIIGWILLANAHSLNDIGFVVMLLIGRFLTGLATGWVIFGISVYISEIASAKLKGLFGNCNQLFITFGILIASVFGIQFGDSPVPYWVVALITGGIVVVYLALLLFTYETPRWLFSKGREYQAIHVLKILRGPNANISKEIDRTRHAVQRTYSLREQLMEFKHRAVYFPFIIVLFLMFFQQFSGINAAVFYAVTILNSTVEDSNRANIVATASVGVTQVIATFIAVILVDFLGRRVLLVVSGSGMALGSALFVAFFVIYDRKCYECLGESCRSLDKIYPAYCTTSIGAIGIVGMVIFIASFSFGWGPIPWSIMSELLPNRVRALAGSIATFVNWTFASIVTLAFSHYADAVTSEFAFLSFAVVMVASVIFVLLFVPETKGRSLEEIQDHFEKGEIFALRLKCFKRRSGENSVQRDHPSRLSITSVGGYGQE